jgi:MoaA/NifB/PqqE/SkfB family radical SAM enzyme
MSEATTRERLRGWKERTPRLGPETVHLDVTNGCNLDCITCWNYAPGLTSPKDAAWKRQRVEPEVFLRVLDEVAACGAERVVVSGGGEPFTHPELPRLLTAVKAKGLRLTLITNGTLCDFDALKALGVDQVLLNLASATPETYVAYHPNQKPETFHRLLAGAKTLHGTTAVNLVQVINAVNARELVAMVDVAASVGARCSFKVGDVPMGTERYALSTAQRRQVLDELIPAARARAKALQVKHNLGAYEAALRGNPLEPVPCFAGYLYSRVAVDGRVFFCCAPIEAGHVSEGTFSQVWSSPRYQALRERMHRGEAFPACARCGKHDMNFAANEDLALLEGDEP